MRDPVELFKHVLQAAEFGRSVSHRLARVRFVDETDEKTLERVISQALKTVCPECRGYGHGAVSDSCRSCHGTGERAYDPFTPKVRRVMES